MVWSTFYDIRRYGGLQIFLRAALTGHRWCYRAHRNLRLISWRGRRARSYAHFGHAVALAAGADESGSSPDRAGVCSLVGRDCGPGDPEPAAGALPQARIAHAFATTEAGVAFDVNDGLAGFPANVLERTPDVEMKIENRTLRVRSKRTARRYLGGTKPCAMRKDLSIPATCWNCERTATTSSGEGTG